MRAVRRLAKEENGAALIISAVGVLVLALLAALALDLGALRNERSAGQKAVDAAATSAVFDVGDNDPVAACETALAYMALNVPNAASFAGTNCNVLPPTCDATTPAATTSGTAGEVTVTITYPVPDTSVYMDAGAIGAGTQTVVAADGEQCQRIAVAATIERETFFARMMGIDTQTTEVHAVAKVISGKDRQSTVALLLLERTECDVLTANGNGGISVGSVVDPETGELLPGQIALDTSATESCGSAMITSGSNASIIADGPPGCPGELAGLPGAGCGETRVFGASGPGCSPPICSSSGTVAPPPTSMSGRITREPLDHLYNCKDTYPAGLGIDGCLDGNPAHIDQLIASLGSSGTPSSWSRYTNAGHSCNLLSDTILVGNWHIDCPSLSVKAQLVIRGGAVFDGDVSITSDGLLAINASPPAFTPEANSVVAFFRNGEISKAGQGALIFEHTVVYLSPGVAFKMTGGDGTFVWTAPITGNFEDLALWSDSSEQVKLAGQANTDMEGVFFAPLAEINYTGNGSQQQVGAQLISLKLSAGGNGALKLKPTPGRSVELIIPLGSELIR
jgi:hypothetical protein